MFKTRLISGILLVIAHCLRIISGGYVLFFTLLCISLIGMQELYKAMGVHGESTGLLEIIGIWEQSFIMSVCFWDLKAMV